MSTPRFSVRRTVGSYISLAGLSVVLAGCSSAGQVLEAKDGLYTAIAMASAPSDEAAARSRAMEAGMQKCASLNKRFQFGSMSSYPSGEESGTAVKVSFQCLGNSS